MAELVPSRPATGRPVTRSRGVESSRQGRSGPGRPRDAQLTGRLTATTVELLADSGWRGLTVDRVATAAGAGKAGVYRRWPQLVALVADALRSLTLVQPGANTGTLGGDLTALTAPLTAPVQAADLAVGAVLTPSRHEPVLREALSAVLDEPLATALDAVTAAAASRGEPLSTAATPLARAILHALWLRRCSTGAVLTHEQQRRLVSMLTAALGEPPQ